MSFNRIKALQHKIPKKSRKKIKRNKCNNYLYYFHKKFDIGRYLLYLYKTKKNPQNPEKDGNTARFDVLSERYLKHKTLPPLPYLGQESDILFQFLFYACTSTSSYTLPLLNLFLYLLDSKGFLHQD